MRIAILANDRATRSGLREVLEEAGATVVYAGPVSDDDAREAARAGPGLVVLDLEGPARIRGAVCRLLGMSEASHGCLGRLDELDKRILGCLSGGAGYTRAAGELHVSAGTVRRRVARMIQLVGAQTRPQLMVWAAANGLVTPPEPEI